MGPASAPLDLSAVELGEAVQRVLRLPAVADKTFLVTIGDRTVTGLVARDQMVGPWQVPVADAAVTASSFDVTTGEAMAMGERTPVALLDAAASARLAVAEAITNLASAPIARLGDVKLSANWMAAAGHPGEDARLYDAVQAVGEELCPALGIAIPVGKDSMSMRRCGRRPARRRAVTAPCRWSSPPSRRSPDVRRTLTPQLRTDMGETELLLVDLGRGRNRLGGSALAQVYGQLGDRPPDLDEPGLLRAFFAADPEAQRRRAAARLPRPLRRRPAGHAPGDGLRRRDRPGGGAAAAGRRSTGGALRRGAGRRDPGPRRGRRAGRLRPRGRGALRRASTGWDGRRRATASPCGRARPSCWRLPAPSCAAIWSETTHAHAGAARRSRLRPRGAGEPL